MRYLIQRFGEKKLPVGKRDNINMDDIYYDNIYEPLPPPRASGDLKNAIAMIAERKEIYSKLPQTDCGACAEHCPTKAVRMVPYEALMP